MSDVRLALAIALLEDAVVAIGKADECRRELSMRCGCGERTRLIELARAKAYWVDVAEGLTRQALYAARGTDAPTVAKPA